MTTRKVIIICKEFYPSLTPRAFRAAELATELGKRGHRVKVFIPSWNGLGEGTDLETFARQRGFALSGLGRSRWPEVQLRGRGLALLARRVARRLLSLLFEYPDIWLMFRIRKLLRVEQDHDLLVSIAVPHPVHWGVAWARTRRTPIASTWVADCGDPYMGCRTDSFRKPFYFKYLEKWFGRKADFITIPFEGAREGYYPEFHHKIRVIPQGFSLEGLDLPVFRKTVDYPVFGYAGGFIPGYRDPGPLLEFLSGWEHPFLFVAYSMNRGMLEPYMERLNGRVEVRDYIPREALLKELSHMDFLLNFDNNTGVQLPSKLIDYSLTGRPVLNITAPFREEPVREFLQGDYSGRMELPPREQYDIRNVANQFLDLCRVP